MSKKFWVVIPAAGVGKRMKSNCPKQYLEIANQTVLDRTISIFISHPNIEGVVVGISANDEYWRDSIWSNHCDVYPYMGGEERSDTVRKGLEYLLDQNLASKEQLVLVHDAARPFLSQKALEKVLQHQGDNGCLLALPCRDTIKRQSPERVVAATLDRSALWQAQTPQCFPVGSLKEALIKADTEKLPITDESSAMELIGWKPTLIEGEVLNFKITSPEDLVLAQAILN